MCIFIWMTLMVNHQRLNVPFLPNFNWPTACYVVIHWKHYPQSYLWHWFTSIMIGILWQLTWHIRMATLHCWLHYILMGFLNLYKPDSFYIDVWQFSYFFLKFTLNIYTDMLLICGSENYWNKDSNWCLWFIWCKTVCYWVLGTISHYRFEKC